MYETVGQLEVVKSCRPEAARIPKDSRKYHSEAKRRWSDVGAARQIPTTSQ
jgi:hypothetical protein